MCNPARSVKSITNNQSNTVSNFEAEPAPMKFISMDLIG